MRNVGLIAERDPKTAPPVALPTELRVFSADNHVEVGDDIFYEMFPARLKEKAPRVWFDQYWRIGQKDGVEAFRLGPKGTQCLIHCNLPTVADLDVRCQALDDEGIEFEICFPQTLLGYSRHPDPEVKENVFRIYNEYTMERFRKYGNRSHPVAVFSNWWDPDAFDRAMEQIVALGYKTFLIPFAPGKGPEGRELSYADPHFDRFWAIADEAGLPVCFHVSEGPDLERRGGIGASNMVLVAPFRAPFAQLLFGGVFDRNPSLKIVFAEGGIAWVPPALQDAEHLFDSFVNGKLVERLEHRPSDYWHNHCYATFQNDRLGLSQIDLIGAGRVMWASDYPHSEGSYGYGRHSMKTVVDMVGEEKARDILGRTAIKLFNVEG